MGGLTSLGVSEGGGKSRSYGWRFASPRPLGFLAVPAFLQFLGVT